MPSSSRPYQSRFLRSVLSQFQQGMARQQHLWQKVKSTFIWGTQAALYPLYVLLRTVRTTGQQLGSTPRRLLDRFRPRSSESEHAATAPVASRVVVSSRWSAPGTGATDQSIIHALTMARQWHLPTAAGPLVRGLRGWLGRPSATAPLTRLPGKFPKVRGIAVDLELRSLQLIDADNCPLPALTDVQSQALQQIILTGLSDADPLGPEASLPAAAAYPSLAATGSPPSKSLTARVVRRLPFVGALFHPDSAELAQSNTPSAQPVSQTLDPFLSPYSSFDTGATALPYHDPQVAASSHRIPPPSAWDVPIIESAYVEHPLETVLRWIDGTLAWLEGYVARIWSWLSHAMP